MQFTNLRIGQLAVLDVRNVSVDLTDPDQEILNKHAHATDVYVLPGHTLGSESCSIELFREPDLLQHEPAPCLLAAG